MIPAAPIPKENQGQPAPRIDGRLKVTGEARYAADMPLSNIAYGVLVTSDIARGRVKAIALEEARRQRGVLDIISYGDMDGVEKPEFGTSAATSLGPLHQKEIVHDGQIVALVVADTFEAASEAADRIKVDYDEQKPTATFGLPGGETVDAAGKSELYKEDLKAGDFDGAFAAAAVKIEAEYATSANTHNPMELFSTTCEWRDGKLTVYEPTQNTFGFRAAIARQLHMDQRDVRVICPYTGGGFGSKGPVTPRSAIVAVAARRVGRPVRCVVSRMQGFTTTTYRAETQHRIRIGATEDGHIAAFGHEGSEVCSRIDDYVVGGAEATARMYNYGSVMTKVRMVKCDRQTPGYMRSPPETPYMFPLESAMDELAVRLKMDPIELRRINDTDKDPVTGRPYSSRGVMRCFDEAAKVFGWSKRNPAPGSHRDGEWLIGWGCAMAVYPTNVGAATARVRLFADGKVEVQSSSHEIGTGIRTVAAQMAAEHLGVPLESVRVEMGDTDLPPAPVSGGSTSTASVCSAVLKACEGIRQRLADAAIGHGPLSGQQPASLRLSGQRLHSSDGASQPVSDVLASMQTGMIEQYAEFVPEGAPPDAASKLYQGKSTLIGGSHGKKLKYAFGAELVEVRIHSRSKEIRIPRMVGAFTAGRIMNTRTARSQLMGGMVWGMASGLLEATVVDPRNARYVNRDLQDYLLPVAADIGDVEVILLPEVDNDVNPAGVKGLGELGNVGTNAAVANAVYHATGRRIRRIPIRIEDMLV